MILVDNQANIYTAVTLVIAVFFYSCSASPVLHELKGEAQGTTYTIKYIGDQSVTYEMVDSVIESMDIEMNSWREDSRITRSINSLEQIQYFLFTMKVRFGLLCGIFLGR